MLTKGDFHGLPTYTLQNDFTRVEVLAEAGPRLVRLFVNGVDENLLAEAPNFQIETVYGTYHFRGGHRLWHAPEGFPRSYIPDTSGVTVEELADGVALHARTEVQSGIRKDLSLRLHEGRTGLRLEHVLHNESLWPVELAPWGITQLPLGGTAILPMPLEPGATLPDRVLTLWYFTRWSDPRLEFYDDFLIVRGQPVLPPFKIGYLNRAGWLGYLRNTTFFVKRFLPEPTRPHTDRGSNAECFCNDELIELETLAPLHRLEPGQSATHIEDWEIFTGVDASSTPDSIRSLISKLNL